MIDTHAHLDGLGAPDELAAALTRAAEAGLSHIIAVGGEPGANALAVNVARARPDLVHAAAGYGRELADGPPETDTLDAALQAPQVVAVGEIGLDYHYLPETATQQEALFSGMLALARQHGLPVIVHSREAEDATHRLLAEHARLWPGDPARIGVLHCFTGSARFAKQLLALGLYISFSGIVTFKKADALRKVAAQVPADRLLIETDTPYLAPEPHRGKRNEPGYLPHVAETLAALRGVSRAALDERTTRNARLLFGLPALTSQAVHAPPSR